MPSSAIRTFADPDDYATSNAQVPRRDRATSRSTDLRSGTLRRNRSIGMDPPGMLRGPAGNESQTIPAVTPDASHLQALRKSGPTETTVTEIATRLGFWQFGRFAGTYKELFGESPRPCGRVAAQRAPGVLPLCIFAETA
jgi:hypothetical protein